MTNYIFQATEHIVNYIKKNLGYQEGEFSRDNITNELLERLLNKIPEEKIKLTPQEENILTKYLNNKSGDLKNFFLQMEKIFINSLGIENYKQLLKQITKEFLQQNIIDIDLEEYEDLEE